MLVSNKHKHAPFFLNILPLRKKRMRRKNRFYAEFDWFEFRFFLLDQMPYKGSRAPSALLFNHISRENSCIYTISNGISAIWNTKSSILYLLNLFLSSIGLDRSSKLHSGTVGWGCRIHQLLLYSGVTLPPNVNPRYDFKRFDGKTPVNLELWGMRSTPLLPTSTRARNGSSW